MQITKEKQYKQAEEIVEKEPAEVICEPYVYEPCGPCMCEDFEEEREQYNEVIKGLEDDIKEQKHGCEEQLLICNNKINEECKNN